MEPYDGFLRDRLGLTTSEFLETVLELERQIVAGLVTYRDAMRIQVAIDGEFDAWCDGEGKLVPKAMREETFAAQSGIQNRVAEAMRLVEQRPPFPFEIVLNERTSAAGRRAAAAPQPRTVFLGSVRRERPRGAVRPRLQQMAKKGVTTFRLTEQRRLSHVRDHVPDNGQPPRRR